MLGSRYAGLAPPTPSPSLATASTCRPGTWTGVVTGLFEGPNHLLATAAGAQGTRTVALTVTNHPISGPIISGPHQQPFYCQTDDAGLGQPVDGDCFAPTQVHWYARDVLGQFHLLASPHAPYPALTATTQAGGQTVPFVVRVESSVINRSITRVAVLDDPRARGPDAPYTPSSAWNRRLVYHFGESCGTGYHQGSNSETDAFGSVLDLVKLDTSNLTGPLLSLADHLGAGYMVAKSSLTTLGVHCNTVLSAETLAMVKEHIGDAYGRVAHTIGGGGSGGAIQQYTAADNYPGLLDAGTPILSYPDVVSTAMTVHDCRVLLGVFDRDPDRWGGLLNPISLKQMAVTGLATPQVCRSWEDLFAGNLSPTANCHGSIPRETRYHPQDNPGGVRCTIQDNYTNILGVDPATGFAHRPIDNVGVQYGLVALRQGSLSTDDFIALNRGAGGLDVDGNPMPARSEMSEDLAALVYRIGALTGRGALDQIPIIDLSIPAVDFVPLLDIHDQIRPFEARARLDASGGGHGSQAIWSAVPWPADAIRSADAWLDRLDAILAANPAIDRSTAVAQARPSETGDQCRLLVTGLPGPCDQGVLRHSGTRQQAGGPPTEDNIKCQLKAVDPADYPSTVTPAQLQQIRSIFPDGVCDWSKPPVGFTPKAVTWNSFGADGDLNSPALVVPYTLVRSAAAGDPTVLATDVGARTDDGRSSRLPPTGGAPLVWLAGLALLFVLALRYGRNAGSFQWRDGHDTTVPDRDDAAGLAPAVDGTSRRGPRPRPTRRRSHRPGR
ncbi:MAG: DUF6351 family protein [Acidimicrobiales bacterium]